MNFCLEACRFIIFRYKLHISVQLKYLSLNAKKWFV